MVFRIDADRTNWSRADRTVGDGARGGELVPDFSIVLQQVLVAAESLNRLAAALRGWRDARESEVAFAFDCPDDGSRSIGVIPAKARSADNREAL